MVDELEQGTNRYLSQLPKTISSPVVYALTSMLDSHAIESNVDEIEAKYTTYKLTLSQNLNLMQSLYPLCEKFSHTLVQLNQACAKFDAELSWLHNSSDNEATLKDKDEVFEELKRGVCENEDLIAELEGPLAAQIVDELSANREDASGSSDLAFCQEFIQDLNNNISGVKVKFEDLNEKLAQYASMLEARRLKTKG